MSADFYTVRYYQNEHDLRRFVLWLEERRSADNLECCGVMQVGAATAVIFKPVDAITVKGAA